jgi:hypothetical protein
VAAALAALERAGLSHGRVTPRNVFLESLEERRPWRNPFVDEWDGRARLGPPALTSPAEAAIADTRGLGRVIAHLLVGGAPAAGPVGSWEGMPAELALVVETALAGRYASVVTLGADLAAVLALRRPQHPGTVRPAPDA